MRATLFTTIFFCGFCLTAFSQASDIIRIQSKTTYDNDRPRNIGKPFLFSDSIALNNLAEFLPIGKKSNDQNLLEIKLAEATMHMPILEPEGHFSMQIHKPDSIDSNTLLIKEYQQQ